MMELWWQNEDTAETSLFEEKSVIYHLNTLMFIKFSASILDHPSKALCANVYILDCKLCKYLSEDLCYLCYLSLVICARFFCVDKFSVKTCEVVSFRGVKSGSKCSLRKVNN
jgi:hypothetical protein